MRVTRAEALQALVRFDEALDSAAAALWQFPFDWNHDEPLALLKRGDVLAVLSRWRIGEVTADDVEQWANYMEAREDLDYDPLVADAIFKLANPLLVGPLQTIGPELMTALSEQMHWLVRTRG